MVPANAALRIRAILDFEEEGGEKRTAGDEWLFEGPGTDSYREHVIAAGFNSVLKPIFELISKALSQPKWKTRCDNFRIKLLFCLKKTKTFEKSLHIAFWVMIIHCALTVAWTCLFHLQTGSVGHGFVEFIHKLNGPVLISVIVVFLVIFAVIFFQEFIYARHRKLRAIKQLQPGTMEDWSCIVFVL